MKTNLGIKRYYCSYWDGVIVDKIFIEQNALELKVKAAHCAESTEEIFKVKQKVLTL
jgi:hypothetical protein